MQTLRAEYFAAYRNLKLSRDDKGVLVAEFHSDGGPFIMNAQAHTEFVDAFHNAERRIMPHGRRRNLRLYRGGTCWLGIIWPNFRDRVASGHRCH
jgi:hypothetical protein